MPLMSDQRAEESGSENDRCEHKNASWPRACGKPAKATVTEGDRHQMGKRLCGVHAKVWSRIGWRVEYD